MDGANEESLPDAQPEGFEVDGRIREWKLGKEPRSDQDWRLEFRLHVKEMDALFQFAGQQKDELGELRTVIDSLTERNDQLNEVQRQSSFRLGKRPETSEEIDAEVRLRDLERRWEVELEDRKHRADLSFEQSTLIRRAEGVRGWALVAVVFAIIASPWVAMVSGVAAKDFSLYVTPVTGIAGAIIGYWFGQGQQNELKSPTVVNWPAPTPRRESP